MVLRGIWQLYNVDLNLEFLSNCGGTRYV